MNQNNLKKSDKKNSKFVLIDAKKSKKIILNFDFNQVLSLNSKLPLAKFGAKIYYLLVENFSQTFFVGGLVRDLLLHKTITDIDIATVATPEVVMKLFEKNAINYRQTGKKFGVIVAIDNELEVEIATFRKDDYQKTRYPKVTFIKSAKQDSLRRDFTINSLYLSLINKRILDLHGGRADLSKKVIRFIGNPEIRIQEDPLRIVRALRFAESLNFTFDKQTLFFVKKYFYLIKKLSESRIKTEINKIKDPVNKKIIKSTIDDPKILDKKFF